MNIYCYCYNTLCAVCWPQDTPPVEDTPPPLDPLDALMAKYAGEIDKMYDRRTRGDYSSLGILSAFMRELRELEN